MKFRHLLLLLSLSTNALPAATIVCDGVLGNSGEQGATLVRFGPNPVGAGPASDRFGTLWERGAKDTINRYTLDGRLVGQYRIAAAVDGSDKLTLVGDTLVAQFGRKLYTLPITAAPGSEAKPLNRPSDALSFSSADGLLASRLGDELALLNPATGEAKPAGQGAQLTDIELGPDRAIYAASGKQLHKFVNGAAVTNGWPAGAPGMRPQLIGGLWFGHGYHTTILRFSETLQPQPGVTLGGSSGSVIGRLDENPELSTGSGLAKIRENLFAISGPTGVVHLLEWQPKPQKFEIIRRIGALLACRGVALDAEGNIWTGGGSWRWSDSPETPMRFGVPPPTFPGTAQPAVAKDGTMYAPGEMFGHSWLYAGKLNKEVERREWSGPIAGKDVVASVVIGAEKQSLILMAAANGQAQAFKLQGTRLEGNAIPVTITFQTPVKVLTSVAHGSGSTLLAAADGAVIELENYGYNWKETRRWNGWGAGATEKFGARIFIAGDAGHLWVADRDRHRVLCLDPAAKTFLASFGSMDQAGHTLVLLDQPAAIAAAGERAVVYDSSNQRLLKLALRP